MHRFRLLLLLTVSPGLALAQASASRVHELDEVVISAPSAADTLRVVPHSVSVITTEDIERSPSRSVAEVLGREANLNIQSYFGRDKGATVDMRGFGATAVSNVLVLVDGVRLNASDLSGADLSSVALPRSNASKCCVAAAPCATVTARSAASSMC